MGDGLMILWDTTSMQVPAISNIVASMANVCHEYQDLFLPSLKATYSDVPQRLRCGIARGHVYSVGDGQDYVGPCINIASRLQKFLPNVVASRRGISITGESAPYFVTKMVNIRGIGSSELVYINKHEFDQLSQEEKKVFKDP
jgi:class 3 adenylate cyclase